LPGGRFSGTPFDCIILIIAAIAIPNLLRSRIAANEASAVGSMRTINTAELSYSTTYPSVGFTATLINLGKNGGDCTAPTSTTACLIDDSLATTSATVLKSGYYFALGTSASVGYTLNGTPGSSSYGVRISTLTALALFALTRTPQPLRRAPLSSNG
jgi:type II secretory pathway pseudopilin PulG